MSSVKMNMQDIKFKMIVLCLKPLTVFRIISSEVPWNFIAWMYKNLDSKGVRRYGHQIDIVVSSASPCSLPAFFSLDMRNKGEQKGLLTSWQQKVGSRICLG